MVQLPKYVAIKSLSNKKYLRPVSGSKRLLKFDGADVTSRGVKHEVVYSKSQPGKVHIRCVDTGTYWGWPEYGSAGNHNHNVCPYRTVRLIASFIDHTPTFRAPQKYRKISISFKIIFWGVLYKKSAGIIAAQIKKPDSRLSGDTCAQFWKFQRMRCGFPSKQAVRDFKKKTESEGRKNPTNFIIEDWKKASRPKPEGGTGTSTGKTGTGRGGASDDDDDNLNDDEDGDDLNEDEDEDLNDDDDGDPDNDDGENKKNTGGGASTVNNLLTKKKKKKL